MPRGHSDWNKFFAKIQHELPAGATPRQRGEAARRAAALWRAGKTRSNPDSGDLLKYGLIVGAGYLGYRLLKQRSAAAS